MKDAVWRRDQREDLWRLRELDPGQTRGPAGWVRRSRHVGSFRPGLGVHGREHLRGQGWGHPDAARGGGLERDHALDPHDPGFGPGYARGGIADHA